MEELWTTRNEVSESRAKASMVADKAFTVGTAGVKVLIENMNDMDADSLKSVAEYLVGSLKDPVTLVLGSCPGDGKVSLVAAFSPGIVEVGIQAVKFIGSITKMRGRPNFA